jgi:hypothetical protein
MAPLLPTRDLRIKIKQNANPVSCCCAQLVECRVRDDNRGRFQLQHCADRVHTQPVASQAHCKISCLHPLPAATGVEFFHSKTPTRPTMAQAIGV